MSEGLLQVAGGRFSIQVCDMTDVDPDGSGLKVGSVDGFGSALSVRLNDCEGFNAEITRERAVALVRKGVELLFEGALPPFDLEGKGPELLVTVSLT